MKLKSNEPFWLVKNGLINTYPSLRENHKTEILIIGAGITGSLIAHQCIQDGYDTTIIDRRDIANGSTSATTSMLQYEIDMPLWELINMIGEKGAVMSYQACSDAIDQLGDIVKDIKSNCGFKKKKSLYYAARKKDVASLKKEFETRAHYHFPVTWFAPEEIEKQFHIKNTYGGILSEQGASFDAYQCANDLLIFNQKKGLKIFDKTDVVKVKYGKTIKATTEFGTTIEAKKIIYCNGFESTEIIKEDFVDLLSTYAIVSESTEGLNTEIKDLLIWNTAEPYLYMRTTEDGRFLVGGEDEEFVNPKLRDKLIDRKSNTLIKKLKKIKPDFEFKLDYSWAGTFGETKDGLPYIGKHKKFKNAYFVLGFGGNGITFSVTGMAMVSAMLHKQSHPLDKYFRFGR